jgi:hypothetical protein
MLSVNLIARSLDKQDPDRLLKGLADNGMVLPLPLRMVLADSTAALAGLALRRLLELTYGPTDLSRQLANQLLSSQQADGRFGKSDDFGLGTAAAVAALCRLVEDHRLDAEQSQQILTAIGRGSAWLDSAIDADGLLTDVNGSGNAALATAFLVYLLVHESAFTAMVPLHRTLGWFEQHEDRLDRSTRSVWRVAAASVQPQVFANAA